MKIGIITEGESEVQALPPIIQQIRARTGNTIVNPAYSRFTPNSDPIRIAKACKPRISLLVTGKKIDRLIVLVDRETEDRTVDSIESELSPLILQAARPVEDVIVIVKNLAFENWLISDPEALRKVPNRFTLTANQVSQIERAGADGIDASGILRKITPSRAAYRKVQDARTILLHADIDRMAANSHSFDRFLSACN